jgi:CubicO group peptidase (beta-lactamase class C family)
MNDLDLSAVEMFREPQHRMAHVEVPALQPRPWPTRGIMLEAEIVGAGRQLHLEEYIEVTSSTSLVVVVDGRLVHEWYTPSVSPGDRLLGNSATKSALAVVTGMAVRGGQLPDLDARVVEFVPELAGSGYDRVTVRHVLSMTSALDWVEDYHSPDSVASQWIRQWRDGAGGTRGLLAKLRSGAAPGSRYAYCSPDSMVLDWVRERATGLTYPEAIARLWGVLGAERPAVVGFDGPPGDGGVAMAAAALAATARDWARIGVLQVDGSFGGQQILDREWVDASSRPGRPYCRPGRLPSTITTHAGFGYHWWPLDDAGAKVMADGMQGQFVYVDRPRRTVVVKTSAWPYDDPWWDRQCRDLSYLALPAIAEAAAAAR